MPLGGFADPPYLPATCSASLADVREDRAAGSL